MNETPLTGITNTRRSPSAQLVFTHSKPVFAASLTVTALIAWIFGGISVVDDHSNGEPGSPNMVLLYLVVVVWLAVSVVLLCAILWILFGRRVLEISQNLVVVKWQIFSRTFRTPICLANADRRQLRIERYYTKYRGKSASRYQINLTDQGSATVLLSDLSESQAKAVQKGPNGSLFETPAFIAKDVDHLFEHTTTTSEPRRAPRNPPPVDGSNSPT